MKRFWGCVLVAAGITFGFCTHAVAYGEKIGYLNVAKVIAQSDWGKQITSNLKSDQEQLTSAVQQKKDEFTAARNSYMKERDILDAKARSRKEQHLEQLAGQLQQLVSSSQMKWEQERKQAMEPLFLKMYKVARKVAKDDNYDMIVDRSALIVVNPKDDITSRVVAELNRTPH
ncbi:MAG: OmpH family outer membrane protein [Deltaproteobacteria bacterium]|jgi:outer membrane protein|nr:OmpH family outer membrane protein [Deltaproteobacteria bacterium]MDA8305444.1 OmpH family outer membrane protein [Deltaproteobacteria bacterium]